MSSQYGNRQKHETTNPIQRKLIDHFHDQLAGLVRAAGPRDLLDVGCGEGYVLAALEARGVRCAMSGIDFSESAVADGRQRVPEADLRVKDARELAAEGQHYDLVLMLEVLEHIPEPQTMLPVLERIARNDVILSVPWEPFFRGLNFLRGKHVAALGNDPEHVNHWGRSGFMRFVSERFEVRAAPLAFPWTLVHCRKRTLGS